MEVGVQDISITVNPPQNVTVDVASGGVTSMPVSSVGGPKGDDGYTPQKNVDYFDGVDGLGFTGGSYNGSTGVVSFTSDDGLGFATGDLRGTDGTDGYNPMTVSSSAPASPTQGDLWYQP